jgi:hypothetical protein
MDLHEFEQLVNNGEDLDLEDDDYGIIIGADGKLKLILLPDEVESSDDVPEIIGEIISMFDRRTIYSQSRVIH